MKCSLPRKGLAVVNILLFVGISVIPSGISIQTHAKKIITVDDEPGDADYTCIQDAVDNAEEGDIIMVYSGIYEPTRIRKTIILEGISYELGSGNDTGKPVIQQQDDHDRLLTLIDVNDCTIQGFDLLHGGEGIIIFASSDNVILENNISFCDKGISVHSITGTSKNNYFVENIIKDNDIGMDFEFSFYNVICNNQIFNNRENGIELSYSEQNKIFNNIFKNNGFFDEQGSGVYFFISSDNIVEDNIFKGNRMGIMLVYDSSNNSIKYNNFLHNIRSIVIYGPSNNSIKYNNFLHNIRSATFYLSNNNTWDYNYWNRPRLLPKLIIGYNEGEYSMILQINTDWHPARKPYNIPGIR